MSDVVPSIYATRAAGESRPGYESVFENTKLRPGEVVRIVYPEDKASRSRKFIEYDCLVQHRENNTAVTMMYERCPLINDLAGLADYSFHTLRPSQQQAGVATDDASPAQLTLGSKVLLHCINGEHAEALIVGGLRDERSTDLGRKEKGHHLETEFNGVRLEVKDDGSYAVVFKGPTTADGKLDTGKVPESAVGTTLQVSADGNWTVFTRDRKQYVEVNHKDGAITVHADKTLTIHGSRINVGEGADEAMVLGNTLVDVLGELIDAMAVEQHATPVGIPTGPPFQAPIYKALKLKLQTALSRFEYVKKTP